MHKLFSKMEFVRGGHGSVVEQLDEGDEDVGDGAEEERTGLEALMALDGEKTVGGWLESDDIEDF